MGRSSPERRLGDRFSRQGGVDGALPAAQQGGRGSAGKRSNPREGEDGEAEQDGGGQEDAPDGDLHHRARNLPTSARVPPSCLSG